MGKDRPSRKLAVILHADVVGSTELVQKNEMVAHERIKETFEKFSRTIDDYEGRTREIRGDALVAEFDRASDAVASAILFQSSNSAGSGAGIEEIHPFLRIGISLGEVVIADGMITGAGVIIAQRLEQLAETGGIVVQGSIVDTVPNRLPFEFRSLGEVKLKGFEQPVRAFTANAKPDVEAARSMSGSNLVADAASQTSRRQRTCIAVLPLENMSNDPEQEIFGDGIAEDIITQLSKLSHLDVVARTSTFAYKGKSDDIRQIGKDLGASHVLEGSVRKSGNRVRITAQLIDAAAGQHVWADRYDRELENIFEVQDDIMREIVSELDVKMLAGEQARFWSDSTSNFQAWDHFRRARDLFNGYRREYHPEIIKLLEKALEHDPEYSAAWDSLAGCYFHIEDDTRYSDSEREEAKRCSREYVQKSIECDPSNPTAWSLRAMHYLSNRDFEEAVTNANKAVSIAPNHAIVVASSSAILTKCGHPELGYERIRRAIELSPIVPMWFYVHLGQPCRLLGKIDEALNAYREMLERDADQIEGHIGLAGLLSESGDFEGANRHVGEILRLNPEFSISRYFRNLAFRDQTIIERFAAALGKLDLPEQNW